jgi:hypothetical protein
MNELIHIAALIGTTIIIVRSTLFRPIQKLWPALFQCSQCTGVWVGAAAGGCGIIQIGHGPLLDALMVGAATSFLATLADAVLLKLLGDPDTGETS